MHHTKTVDLNSRGSAFKVWGMLFLVASYSFLAYKLITFNRYNDLAAELSQLTISRYGWLLLVFLFLPLNWLIESVKWKMMTAHVQAISLKTSIKAILAGISTGFFTPNRVGDLVGRVMYLNAENRKPGVTLSLLSGMTQSIVMTLYGLPACILFFANSKANHPAAAGYYTVILLVSLIAIGLLYFFLPQISRLFSKSKFSDKIKEYTNCLLDYSPQELLLIISVSMLRYTVFCVQFYFMLRFFGVELTASQALVAIPTSYLFVTFTPSFAFSDVAVRSSIAVLVIGVFSSQVIGIALAGMCIWLINFALPMLVGSVVLLKRK